MNDYYGANGPQARYIMPEFIERTPNGERVMNAYAKLFEERIVFVGTPIDQTVANDVMAQLLVLESQDPDRDITMYINSPGGSVPDMLAIYDTMQYVHCDIVTVCLGEAASAAAIMSPKSSNSTDALVIPSPSSRARERHSTAAAPTRGPSTTPASSSRRRAREWSPNCAAVCRHITSAANCPLSPAVWAAASAMPRPMKRLLWRMSTIRPLSIGKSM